MSRLFMLKPSDGIEGVKDAIVRAVKEAGANPCPPVIVGVGIGGTAEQAMELAKRQLCVKRERIVTTKLSRGWKKIRLKQSTRSE